MKNTPLSNAKRLEIEYIEAEKVNTSLSNEQVKRCMGSEFFNKAPPPKNSEKYQDYQKYIDSCNAGEKAGKQSLPDLHDIKKEQENMQIKNNKLHKYAMFISTLHQILSKAN